VLGIRRTREGRYAEALVCFRLVRQAHLAAASGPCSLRPGDALAFAMGTHARLGSGVMVGLPSDIVYRVVANWREWEQW
jgi:hypothetical protein